MIRASTLLVSSKTQQHLMVYFSASLEILGFIRVVLFQFDHSVELQIQLIPFLDQKTFLPSSTLHHFFSITNSRTPVAPEFLKKTSRLELICLQSISFKLGYVSSLIHHDLFALLWPGELGECFNWSKWVYLYLIRFLRCWLMLLIVRG